VRDSFRLALIQVIKDEDVDAVFRMIEDEYEFQCPAFIQAGPGHQSKHECMYHRPHAIDSEHYDSMYYWEGTAVKEVVDGRTKLIHNPKHYGGYCC
jgi:hypothetical protein